MKMLLFYNHLTPVWFLCLGNRDVTFFQKYSSFPLLVDTHVDIWPGDYASLTIPSKWFSFVA